MHIVRFCIHRPGDTAERLLAVLADRQTARIVGREPVVRGLFTRGANRRKILAEFERDLDAIARELRVEHWREIVGVD